MSLHPLAALGKQPEGATGLAIAAAMDAINSQMQNHAIRCLRPYRLHSLLEIGFGGGGMAAKLDATGLVAYYVGVDTSETMVRAFNAKQLNRNHAHALRASVEDMPLADEQFDAAIAMNVIYWWPDPAAGLKEIRRVLKPGGILMIGMVPAGDDIPPGYGEPDGPLRYDEDQLAVLVRDAGFMPLSIEHIVETLKVNGAGTRNYVLAFAEAV